MDQLALGIGISMLLVIERIPSLRLVHAPLWRPHLLSDLACLASGATALGLVMREAAIALGARLPSAGPLLDELPPAAVLTAAVVAYDLGSYVTHRLLHASDLLWRLHAVHHSSRTLDWLATFRAHVLEHALRHLASPVILLLIGFPPRAVAAAAGIHVAFAMLNHANLRCGATAFEVLLVTPRLHRLHHVSGSCGRNLAEAWAGRHGRRVRYERRDTAASLAMGVGNVAIGAGIGSLVVAAFVAAHRMAPLQIGWAWWAWVACFLAEDLASYWFHRISRERRWFWASHVVHHSSQRYNLSTALRQTWTGKATLGFVFWLPLVAIGFAPQMVLFFTATSLLHQFWIHTEAIDRLGPLEALLNNPLRIAFHEWAAIARDVRDASTWRERLGYLFGPPGWSPDGSRETSAMIQARWRAEQARAELAAGELASAA